MVEGGVAKEAVKAFENIKSILIAAGSSVDGVVKCTVYLNDMNDFADFNKEYSKCELKIKFLSRNSSKKNFKKNPDN